MASRTVKHCKITIRQPVELKQKIERAAAMRGMTATSFINSVLERASDRTLARVRAREITERDQRRLLALLRVPKGPNAALTKAAIRYRDRYGG